MIREGHNLPAQNLRRSPSVVAVGTLLSRPILAALFVGLTFFAAASSIQAQTQTRSKSQATSRSQAAAKPQTLPLELVNRLQQQVRSGKDQREVSRETSERSAESSPSAMNMEAESSTSAAEAQEDSEPSFQEMARESLRRKAALAAQQQSAQDEVEVQPALKRTPEPHIVSRTAMTSRDSAEVSGIQQASVTSEELPETSEQPEETAPIQDPVIPFLDLEPTVRTGGANSPEQSPEVTLATSPANIIVRAVVWLVIAFCLLILAVLGVRRYQRARGLLPSTGNQSRVIETLSVGPGRSVSLIEIAGLRALVAADAGGIRTLVLAPSIFPDELQREMEQPMPLETVQHGQTIAEL